MYEGDAELKIDDGNADGEERDRDAGRNRSEDGEREGDKKEERWAEKEQRTR